ncbi:MAG: LysM peptidoglycan-binding domain-containing protein [Thiohalocapsa sp.]
MPDSLEGDQYVGELRDEVSQTIVFGPAVGAGAPTDGPGVLDKATEPAPGTYQVQPGDSLWKIAEALLGDGYQWTSIYEANQDSLMHKDVLSVGQRLKIPNL